jgi:hypothetical protein
MLIISTLSYEETVYSITLLEIELNSASLHTSSNKLKK